MQTFLPYPSFKRSAKVLDYRRLGKQRVEAFQLIEGMRKPKQFGWRNHPAFKMWLGHSNALKMYFNTMVEEWIGRGYNNTMEPYVLRGNIFLPKWIGTRRLHSSHRANLLRKDPEHYGRFGWKEEPAEGYYWPVWRD